MKIKITSIVYLLTFLVFLGFGGLENYMTLALATIIVLTGINSRGLKKTFWFLTSFLLLHTLIYIINYSSISLDWFAKNAMNPIILFFVGFWLEEHSENNRTPIMMLIYGFFLHATLNILIYLYNPSSMVERSFSNIWGGNITATLHNLLFIPIVGLLFYALFFCRSKIQKYFLIIASAIAIYGTIISASRTLLYLIIIVFMINLVLNSSRSDLHKTKIYLSIFFIVVFLLGSYEFDLLGIRTWVESSSLGERLYGNISSNDSILGNIRWTMSMKVLIALGEQPFGNINVVNYAHNLFIDMAKYTGIFPALGLFIWCITSVVRYGKFIIKGEKAEWSIAIWGIAIAFMIAFFLEPVLEGLPIVFSAFCYLSGIMLCQTSKTKR